MNYRTLSVIALMGLVAVGCGQGGPLNANALGDMIGGDAGHAIKAGGHVANAAAMSEKDEDSLGQSVGLALTNRYPVYENPKVLKYVTMVGLTVATASPSPNGNYVFGVLVADEPNAFSGPNGYIFVTTGLLSQMQDEAELAGVLAHEVAHVCRHHGLKQVKSAEMQGAAAEAMKSARTEAAQYAAMMEMGVDVLTKQGYTQPQEHDADKLGVQILTAAGYDARSYLKFLQRMQSSAGAGGNRLMSTHPGLPARVQRVAQQVQTTPPGGATLAERYVKRVTEK